MEQILGVSVFHLSSRHCSFLFFSFFPFQMIDTVKQSDSLDWCIDRCQSYGHKAISALDIFTASDAKQALTNIANATTNIVLGKS